ncbi:MAG: type II toxin-antitoxin system PemK/MazF family toxin [Calditrichaeota bacterium]|nr:MAG: type II toxin-antitoxin system PemK/MazF family toxin [Calditrichota bacterium]
MLRQAQYDKTILSIATTLKRETTRRPALVLCTLKGDDLILCQITSQKVSDSYSIVLVNQDFATGSLKRSSYIRPNRIFTADKSIILYKVGSLKKEKIGEVIDKVVEILRTK